MSKLPVPTELRSDDGALVIEPISDHESRLVSKPAQPDFFVSRESFVTRYPPDLIERIFKIKGLARVLFRSLQSQSTGNMN